jgi:hypothetical protein
MTAAATNPGSVLDAFGAPPHAEAWLLGELAAGDRERDRHQREPVPELGERVVRRCR